LILHSGSAAHVSQQVEKYKYVSQQIKFSYQQLDLVVADIVLGQLDQQLGQLFPKNKFSYSCIADHVADQVQV